MARRAQCKAKTKRGERCKRPAFHAGLCVQHAKSKNKQPRSERESAEISDAKGRFLQALVARPLTIAQAAKHVGRSERTIRLWAATDAAFAEQYTAAKLEQRQLRLTTIEDVVFQRIIEGKAGAALTIFTLKGLDPEGWGRADKYGVDHSGEVKFGHADVSRLSDEELARAALRGAAPTDESPETP